jgi:hypothetical protein
MAQQPAETDLRGGAVGGVGLRGKRKEKTSGGGEEPRARGATVGDSGMG